MSVTTDFFNYSKFEVRANNSNSKAVVVDVAYNLSLEVYDVICIQVPALVTAVLKTKDGRNEVTLPTVVTVTPYGTLTSMFSFTVATADWDGALPLILEITVTDAESFVYIIDHSIKA